MIIISTSLDNIQKGTDAFSHNMEALKHNILKVRSFAEQDDTVNAAWSAPGVSQVENNLELEETEYAW